MSDTPWWASESLRRKCAIWVTAFMLVVLIILTFDSVERIAAGSERVPAYSIINQRICYRFNRERNMMEPVIGDEAPLFGQVLGLGHHYFWIGTPEYWLTIGGFFSALEPIPLVAMVVHAVYDSGVHRFKNSNHPALAWLIAHAFGNFFGAGVWGFMHTLPQINLYTHGTQWSASHGHLAFWGAYATINIAMFYIAIQHARGGIYMGAGIPGAWRWKWSLALTSAGMVGMTVALLIAGYEQSFVERALEGSTWAGYFAAQRAPWFLQGMLWRQIWGVVMAAGVVLLVWDLLVIGRGEKRPAAEHEPAHGVPEPAPMPAVAMSPAD